MGVACRFFLHEPRFKHHNIIHLCTIFERKKNLIFFLRGVLLSAMATDDCPSRDDGFGYFGLVNDSPCSGFGQCVNASEFSTYFSSLCLCDETHSGESDMFDLRVAKLPSGEYLSLDCPNPRIGVYIVFSIQLIAFFAREITIIVAMAYQYMVKGGPLTLKGIYDFAPYRILLFDMLLANPIVLAFSIQKILPLGIVVGTDVLVTLCLIFGTFGLSVAFNEYEFSQFQSIVRASSMEYDMHEKLLSRQRRIVRGAKLSYWILAGIPSFAALGLDKSKGPVLNYEFVLLLCRNLGIALWAALQWIADMHMKTELEKLSETLQQVSGVSVGATRLLSYLEDRCRHTKKTCIFACLIWGMFSVPVSHTQYHITTTLTIGEIQYFWPFQGYASKFQSSIHFLVLQTDFSSPSR